MAWSGARAKMLSSSVSYADHLRLASEATRGEDAAARGLKQHEHQIALDLERTFPNHAAFRRVCDDGVPNDEKTNENDDDRSYVRWVPHAGPQRR